MGFLLCFAFVAFDLCLKCWFGNIPVRSLRPPEMMAAIRAAILKPQDYYSHLKTALFHSTPILQRKHQSVSLSLLCFLFCKFSIDAWIVPLFELCWINITLFSEFDLVDKSRFDLTSSSDRIQKLEAKGLEERRQSKICVVM